MSENAPAGLLGAGQIRELAGRLGVRPTKQWGQNFVIDANTVRRIVRLADVGRSDVVVEIGPGLGSLTLGLLPQVARVVAVEVDPNLAAALPGTVAALAPAYSDRLEVVLADAMTVRILPDPQPTALVANLPYNISVPVVLSFLEAFPTLRRVLVMVQLEVAEPAHLARAARKVLRRWAKAASMQANTSLRGAGVCGGSRRVSATRPESTFGAGQKTVRLTFPVSLTSAYHAALRLGIP